jgi:phosphonate transport system ATP-binding protein
VNVLSGRLGYVPFWRSFARRYPQADVDKAFALLERVDVLDQAGKRADALSGGQRQRVGIARERPLNTAHIKVDSHRMSLPFGVAASKSTIKRLTPRLTSRGLRALRAGPKI